MQDHDKIMYDVRAAATRMARQWPDLVSAEDLEQDIHVSVLDSNYATRLAQMDDAARADILNKIAFRLAVKERTDYEYFSGNFRYSTNEVRALLDRGALLPGGHETNGEVVSIPADQFGGEEAEDVSAFIETQLEYRVEDYDVRACFRQISRKHQGVLFDRYVKANYTGHTQNITNAVDELTRAMNGAFRKAKANHNGPGSRKAISNAAAQVIIKNQNTDAR